MNKKVNLLYEIYEKAALQIIKLIIWLKIIILIILFN